MCWGLKADEGNSSFTEYKYRKKTEVGLRSMAPTIDAYLFFQPLCVSNDKKD